jgi:hypothetical protein
MTDENKTSQNLVQECDAPLGFTLRVLATRFEIPMSPIISTSLGGATLSSSYETYE